MANRTMEAKRIKMRKERRAWAVPLQRSGMKQPNRIVINEYKDRARGLMLPDDISDGIIQKHAHSMQRRAALQRQAERELQFDAQLRFKGPGPCNDYEESYVYFNSQQSCYFVVHRDKKLFIERRSITYSCKDILVMKWNMGKTTWVELRSFS